MEQHSPQKKQSQDIGGPKLSEKVESQDQRSLQEDQPTEEQVLHQKQKRLDIERQKQHLKDIDQQQQLRAEQLAPERQASDVALQKTTQEQQDDELPQKEVEAAHSESEPECEVLAPPSADDLPIPSFWRKP